MEHDEFDILRNRPVPSPRDDARAKALQAALGAYDLKNSSVTPKEAKAAIVSSIEQSSFGGKP